MTRSQTYRSTAVSLHICFSSHFKRSKGYLRRFHFVSLDVETGTYMLDDVLFLSFHALLENHVNT